MLSFGLLRQLWLTDFSAFGMLLFSLVLGFSVLALMIAFGIIGQAGAIRGLIRADQGEKPVIKDNFHQGVSRFWPILEINFFTKVVLFGVLVLVIYFVSLMLPFSGWLESVLYVLAFTFFVVASIVIYFLTIYSTTFAVLRNENAWRALLHGYQLFKKAVWLNLEIGLMMFLLNLVAAMLFVSYALIVSLPFVAIYLVALNLGWNWVLGLAGLLLVILLTASAVIFGAWYNTFQLGVWVILFEEQMAERAHSKLKRVVHHVKLKWSEKKS